MKGYISNHFKNVFSKDVESVYFVEGDEIEIIRIIHDESFKSNVGYIIYNPRNHESMTLDSAYINFKKDYCLKHF